MAWKLEHLPALKGYTVEWAEPGNYYLSRRNYIYHSPNLDPPFPKVAAIEAPAWRKAASRFRLAQRLLRFMVYNVVPMRDGDLFVTFDRTVGVIKNGKFRKLPGLDRPCRVLRSGCAIDGLGDIYFGEYLANADRSAVRIYRYPAGGDRLEVAHVFPERSIRHIHGVYFDRFTNSVVCLTGDHMEECRLLRSTDGFASFETIGSGDESWRAVSIQFEDDCFYYGTDAEFQENQIIRLDRASAERRTLGIVSGTVFYSYMIGRDLFFTTTAENAPSQTENVAAIWHIDSEGGPEKVVEYKKDRWPEDLFMFGTIHLPHTASPDRSLYFSLVGLEGDNETFRLSRTAD